ncbi:hypothetical protein Anas_03435 [Armadillidium nasatum]|uniref:Bestrophin homolog n=1 Tax=Armadillidium nasatum TaxID=96803 RepID=A0A5N5T092_9CRUS|nr:hypothetical protein Anas_03435 [Armadillidium nasatum]
MKVNESIIDENIIIRIFIHEYNQDEGGRLLRRQISRREGRILDDMAVKTLIDEINKSRGMCGMLLCYEWISIPLVYTQIVTVAVWSYFISTLMGRQFLDPSQNIPGYNLDYIIPIFTYIEFLVYVGWLKVAETLVNPFGDDDDDFEILWVIERIFK